MKAEAKTSLIQLHTELCPDPKSLSVVAAKGGSQFREFSMFKKVISKRSVKWNLFSHRHMEIGGAEWL